jgi:hypothetical protein
MPLAQVIDKEMSGPGYSSFEEWMQADAEAEAEADWDYEDRDDDE